jgi:hypothetical protein
MGAGCQKVQRRKLVDMRRSNPRGCGGAGVPAPCPLLRGDVDVD